MFGFIIETKALPYIRQLVLVHDFSCFFHVFNQDGLFDALIDNELPENGFIVDLAHCQYVC